jgi:hypothetical protein
VHFFETFKKGKKKILTPSWIPRHFILNGHFMQIQTTKQAKKNFIKLSNIPETQVQKHNKNGTTFLVD